LAVTQKRETNVLFYIYILQDFGSKFTLIPCRPPPSEKLAAAACRRRRRRRRRRRPSAFTFTATALFVQFCGKILYRISNDTTILNVFSAAPCGAIARSRVQLSCPRLAFTVFGGHDAAACL
jgi:hypothetical protein